MGQLLRLTLQADFRHASSHWWGTRPRGQALLLLAAAAWLAIALLLGLVLVLAKCAEVLLGLL